ncbi:MAG TPA: OmpH family outer membrane protein [Coxiellaceae bacterium]|nr:OmpH family outer membrane protein [Coxiellaceae bacterium]
MMKKWFLAGLTAAALTASLSAYAAGVGVVDMQKVFASSSDVKKVTEDLKKQFASREKELRSQGETLQADIGKLNRNQSVMSAKDVKDLQDKVTKESASFRDTQAEYQKDVMEAQNKAMQTFINKLDSVVATVAKKKDLDLVMPKNAIIYSAGDHDITDDVIRGM